MKFKNEVVLKRNNLIFCFYLWERNFIHCYGCLVVNYWESLIIFTFKQLELKQSNNLNIHNNHYYILGLIRVIRRFYNYYVSPDKALVKRLTVLVGFIPANVNVFNLSFSHKSSSSPELYAIQNNERLEYLGDAILGTIVAEYLFRKYPNRDEGFLTKMRSKIVNRKVMNQIGDSMGLDLFIVHNNNSRLSRSMLGNALEALIGAVYLDVGYKKTQRFVFKKILKAHLDIEALETYDDNYKSQLLEWCQKNRKEVTYNVLDKFKMDNRDRFKVAVLIDGNKRADAEDFSKKAAEQKASHKALLKIGVLERED